MFLKCEDVLLMDKVYESEMFVEHATVVLDALLEIGDAHILVAITLQGAQEGLFSEAGDLLRYAAESLETLWGRRLLEFCIFLFPITRKGCGEGMVKRLEQRLTRTRTRTKDGGN